MSSHQFSTWKHAQKVLTFDIQLHWKGHKTCAYKTMGPLVPMLAEGPPGSTQMIFSLPGLTQVLVEFSVERCLWKSSLMHVGLNGIAEECVHLNAQN